MLDQSKICDSKIKDALSKSKKLDSLISAAKSKHLNEIRNNARKIKDEELSSLDSAQSAIDDIYNDAQDKKDQLEEKGSDAISTTDSVENIAECLGLDMEMPATGTEDSVPIPGGNPASAVKSVADDLYNKGAQALEDNLKPAEKALGSAISGLEKAIPKNIVDDLLSYAECLADCSGSSEIPSQTDIEERLGKAGLKTDLSVDYDSPALSDLNMSSSLKDQASNIKDMENSIKDKTGELENIL